MKANLKFLYLILGAFVIPACELLGVSTQATAPGEINSIIETSSSTPGQITYSQMTGTAQAIPTVPFVIEPTQTPAMPGSDEPVATSPNSLYAIACKDPFFILFNTQTKTIISTFGYFPLDCKSDIHWASDSSYALFGALYRWRTDGSQPEFLEINIEVKLNYPDCSVKTRWSPDGQYLAIQKCDLYVVMPDNKESLQKPVLIAECAGCFFDFRWATTHVLMVEYSRAYGFVHIPSGNAIGALGTSGGICAAQIPLISPDEHWMTFDAPWCGGGERGPNQSYIANLDDGSERIFSESFADSIDFIGWEKDSSEFYLVSRPAESEALPNPRTPFGLLALNPQTLQVQNLFEQAWYVAFNKDYSWAYVVFPATNEDGSLKLDGGLWQVGTDQMIGEQVMATSLEEKFFTPYLSPDTGYMYSANGQELGFSADTINRIVPAVWSHENTQVASINANRQLVVINRNGDVHVIGQLNDNQEWLYSVITWSDDDRSLDVDGTTWPLP
jgi:hypothetical protein